MGTLEKHHNIKINPLATVDWEPSRLAMAKLPQGYKRLLVKQLSGHIGVGHILKKRRWQDHSCCPLCNTENEKKYHTSSSVETNHQKKTSEKNWRKISPQHWNPT
jgi:hypothetical protein